VPLHAGPFRKLHSAQARCHAVRPESFFKERELNTQRCLNILLPACNTGKPGVCANGIGDARPAEFLSHVSVDVRFLLRVRACVRLSNRSTLSAFLEYISMPESADRGRVVIAGGSGFLGLSLATHLTNKGWAVTILSRHPPRLGGPWSHINWDARTLNHRARFSCTDRGGSFLR